MKTYRLILSSILSILLFTVLLGCGSGSETVDTTGLSQVTLRVEGMT